MSAGNPGLTVLGLETSCDETAAAVVRVDADGRAQALSSVVHSQMEHAPFGGVVPEIAARAHVEAIQGVADAALRQAGVGVADLDGVAATAGPGLIGGVMVGLSFGKGLAAATGKPLVAVNHLEGHAVSARLGADVPYPFLLLLVSGGHCQLLVVEGVGAVARLGSTLDDAAGEAFDKTAKVLGLGYPGGPALERLAASGDPARYPLPAMLAGRGGFDFSFSGLKTAAARLVQAAETEQDKADVAAAVQAAIARQLAERSARAMDEFARRASRGDLFLQQAQDEVELDGGVLGSPHPEPVEGRGRALRFVVAGGVAANAAVRAALQAEAGHRGFAFFAPPLRFCTDNAAMIALAGAERLALGLVDGLDAPARPRWPLDAAAAAERPLMAVGRKGAKA